MEYIGYHENLVQTWGYGTFFTVFSVVSPTRPKVQRKRKVEDGDWTRVKGTDGEVGRVAPISCVCAVRKDLMTRRRGAGATTHS